VPLINEEVLKYKIDVDPRTGIANARKFDQEFKRGIQDVRKTMKALDRVQKGYFSDTRNAWREVREEMVATDAAIKRCSDDIVEAGASIRTIETALAEAANGTRQLSAAEIDRHKKRIAELKEEIAESEKAREAIADIGEQTVNIKFATATDELRKSLVEVATPITRLLAKDIGGAFEAGGKLAGAAIETSARRMGKWMRTSGSSLAAKGASLATKGAGKTGVSGKSLELLGGAMKGIGGIMGKVGPMIGELAKLGPILSMTAGLMASVVKLMVDAEAQAKEFQKSLLASASNAEFLAQNGNNAAIGFADLKQTVWDIRDASFNLEQNFKWGTTSKDHLAFWNTLNQEGVSIKRMKGEFERARGAGQFAGDAVAYYTEQTAAAVAYSRKFGVALTDIVSFQAEMMTELGQSSDAATTEFARMGVAAGQSGIAANKFFAIMRGVSSDLSLYNMRMEDAVGLLAKLGKAMNPRNAQKFMQQLAQGFKGMGRLERLRMTLLAGEGKTRGVVEKNLADRQASLVKDVVNATHQPEEEVKKAVDAAAKGDRAALRGMLKDVEGGGAMMEAARELKIDTKMSKKGLFGLSQSIGNLTTGGQLEMTKAALGRFGGKPGGKLSDMVGELGPEMMAENLGISREQLNQQVALEEAIDDERVDLAAQLVDQKKMSAEEAKKTVDAMSNDEIIRSLGLNDADLKKQVETDKDIAKRQAELTSSMMDKLGMLLDFVMNQIYNAMMGIWDILVDWFGKDSAKKARELSKSVMESKNPELIKAFTASGGDFSKFKGEVAGGAVGKNLSDSIDAHAKIMEGINAKVAASGGTDAEKSKLREDLVGQARTDPATQKIMQNWQNARGTLEGPGKAGDIMSTAGMAGLSADKLAALRGQLYEKKTDYKGGVHGGTSTREVETGKSFSQAARAAGLTDKEIDEILKKTLWGTNDPTALIRQSAGLTTPTADVKKAATESAVAPTAPGAPAGPPAPVAPVGPPTPAAVAPTGPLTGPLQPASPGAAAAPQTTAEATTQLAATSANMLTTNESMLNAMRQKGIKMDKSFLQNEVGRQMETSVYDAMSRALFEYWLYAGDSSKVKEWVKYAKEHGTTDLSAGSMRDVAKAWITTDTTEGAGMIANAGGGYVTGIRNGIAQTKPLTAAPGEGLLSVGPHEAVIPLNSLGAGAGGGGGGGGGKTAMSLDVNVTGAGGDDFQRGLKATVANYIYEYESKKRLT
jgi:hypothetical protein